MYVVEYTRTTLTDGPCTGQGGRTPDRDEAERLAAALRRLGHILTAEVVQAS